MHSPQSERVMLDANLQQLYDLNRKLSCKNSPRSDTEMYPFNSFHFNNVNLHHMNWTWADVGAVVGMVASRQESCWFEYQLCRCFCVS